MLSVYIVAAVVGGAFVLLSMFGGDGDSDVDHDVDHDLDGDAEAEVDGDAHGELSSDLWIPFFSLRFWTYFLTFFGLTGLILNLFDLSSLLTGILSGGMGMVTGLGMAYMFQYLKRDTTDSSAKLSDLIGMQGKVTVKVTPEQIGKITCSVKGSTRDFLATTEEDALQPGTEVLVIGFDDAVVQVVSLASAKRSRARGKTEKAERLESKSMDESLEESEEQLEIGSRK